ncbi:MAG: HEAT repeat domain-containing protein [Prochlorococcus sp.]|nr:HEAT repeat domain-containing protein [Prochlorococcaceae cyanobacterium ETNP18_MAG_1]
MSCHEDVLRERLNNSRKAPLEPDWLGEVYSLSLSADLRMALGERLGWLGDQGWPTLKQLIDQYGAQAELIHAAGLSHQPQARDWLITQLEQDKELDLGVLKALTCWGAILPTSLLHRVLSEPSQHMRLAGLALLSFKAHQLSAKELLELSEALLDDIRDPVVLATIRLLQRRDESSISNRIAEVAHKGTEAAANAALLALGCIGTANSQAALAKLNGTLPNGPRRELASKQLKQQYRPFQTSSNGE